MLLHKATAAKELIKLSSRGFDVFINLCDGSFDEDRAGRIIQTTIKFFYVHEPI